MSQNDTRILTPLDNEAIRFAPFAILVFDQRNIVEIANSEALRMLADSSDLTEVVGRSLEYIFPGVDFSSVGSESLHRIAAEGKHYLLELQCVKIDKEGYDRTIVYLSQPGGQRQRELLLEKEASTDELSGLANRRAFQRTMESNQHRALSLAIVDIDRFKAVNDDHGHLAGDDVIQRVSGLLRESFSDNSILVSRMGGDEFSVLFETKDASLIVEALNGFREKVTACQLPQRSDVTLSVSIGAAITTQVSIGSRTLLTQADRQLYKAKNEGRNQVAHVFLGE